MLDEILDLSFNIVSFVILHFHAVLNHFLHDLNDLEHDVPEKSPSFVVLKQKLEVFYYSVGNKHVNFDVFLLQFIRNKAGTFVNLILVVVFMLLKVTVLLIFRV